MTRRLGLAVLLVCLAAAIYVAIRAHRDLTDFEVYRTAADRAAHAEPLYRATDGHYQFKYLPAFAILARPLAAMGDEPAKLVWFGFSFALVVILLHTLLTHVPDRRLALGVLSVLTCVVMAKFSIRELALGQTNALLGVLTLPAVVAARKRPGLAGLGVGAAVFVKPYAAILLPWLLVAAPVGALLTALLTIVGGLLLPVVTYGWSGNLALLDSWWRTVTDTTTPNLRHADNVSFVSFWAKWVGVGSVASALAIVAMLALLALIVFVVLRGRRRAGAGYLETGILLLAIPLCSPQGWDYVLLLGTPAIILAIDRWQHVSTLWKALVGVALVVLALPLRLVTTLDGYNAIMMTGVVTLAAIVILLDGAELRRREIA